MWGFVWYDPELDVLYYGTANPGPWNPDVRPGDNEWTAGVFARRPDNGREGLAAVGVLAAHAAPLHPAPERNAMPDVGVDDARRISAYLYTLE